MHSYQLIILKNIESPHENLMKCTLNENAEERPYVSYFHPCYDISTSPTFFLKTITRTKKMNGISNMCFNEIYNSRIFFEIYYGFQNKDKKPLLLWVFHGSNSKNKICGYFHYHICNQRLKIYECTKFQKSKV